MIRKRHFGAERRIVSVPMRNSRHHDAKELTVSTLGLRQGFVRRTIRHPNQFARLEVRRRSHNVAQLFASTMSIHNSWHSLVDQGIPHTTRVAHAGGKINSSFVTIRTKKDTTTPVMFDSGSKRGCCVDILAIGTIVIHEYTGRMCKPCLRWVVSAVT
jgi:hypothetical protein